MTGIRDRHDGDEAWHGRVWRLAWPVILSSMSISALGAVDTAVMGQLPDPAFVGGVAVGATSINFLLWTLMFLRMGTTGLTAQAFGAGNMSEAQATLRRALVISTVLGLALIPIAPLLFDLAFVELGASETVTAHAVTYTDIRVWGLPASLGNTVVLGWLFGLQRTRLALLIQVAFNLLNVVLAVLFVVVFRWDVPGVAAATVIAEWFGLALGLAAIARVTDRMGGRANLKAVLDRARLFAVARINANVFTRSLVLTSAQVHFALQGAQFGDVALAANALLIAIHSVLGMGLDGFAVAAETLVGSAVGRKDRRAFDAAVRAAFLWAALVGVAFSLAYLALGWLAISLMTSLPEVQTASLEFLPWSAAVPIVLVWGYMLDGVFSGATRTADMRNAMILSVAVYTAAYTLLVPLWGNHGLWASFLALQAMRALTLGALYPRAARMAGIRP
jgi:MATE family multidrug resistance protein